MKIKTAGQEYDFALIARGVESLTNDVEDALFKAGCDDATLSMQRGLMYIEFSRAAKSLKDAILSAIRDVRKANVGAEVLKVDACDLVSASEIARRIHRSRQLVFQYINGERGPGGFPPPECHLTEASPLWTWCAVSQWMVENDLLRHEESVNAEVIAAINNSLDAARHHRQNPALLDEIVRNLQMKSGSRLRLAK